MMKNSSKKVSFNSSEVSKPNPSSVNKKRVVTLFWIFRLPKAARFSPEKFLRRLGAKMVKVLRYASLRKRSSSSSCSQKAVSGSNFNRSHSVSGSMESHRAEAVGDCIEFFNSCCSSSSSNSTSSIPKSDLVSGKR